MRTHRELGMLFLNQGSYGRAEDHLRAWVKEHPVDMAAHMELVWCFRERANLFSNRWATCDEFYEKLANEVQGSALIRFVRGEQLYYDDREEEALDEYRAAIEAGLDTAVVRYSMGCALESLERPIEASAEYRLAYEMDPLFVPAAHAYAQHLFVQGRLDYLGGIGDTMKHVDSNNMDFVCRGGANDTLSILEMIQTAHVLREAVAMHRRGCLREAALLLLPVWRSHKNNLWLLRTLVYLLYRCNWLSFAKRIFTKEIPEDSPVLSYARGLLAWYEDAHDEALESYTKAIDQGLVHPLVFVARARVFESMDKTDKEQADLEHAYAHQPWLAYVRSELAWNAYSRSQFQIITELTDLSHEDRDLALRYDVAGHKYLAQLDTLRLRSLLKLDRLDEAVRCVEGDPEPCEDEDLFLARSTVLVEAGIVRQASMELERSVSVDDVVVGKLGEADLQRIERIKDEVPDSFAAEFCLSLRPAYLEESGKARSRLGALAERYPTRAQLWYHIGSLSWIMDEPEKAKAALKKALCLEPSDARACRVLCTILEEGNDIDGLLSLCEGQWAGDYPVIYTMNLAKKRGDDDLLRRVATNSLKPGMAGEEALLHLLHLAQEVEEEFVSILDAYTALVPVDYDGRRYVAQHYLRTGRSRECVDRCENLLADGAVSPRTVMMLGLGRLMEAAVSQNETTRAT